MTRVQSPVQSPFNPGAIWGANPGAIRGNPRCDISPLIPLAIAPALRREVHLFADPVATSHQSLRKVPTDDPY